MPDTVAAIELAQSIRYSDDNRRSSSEENEEQLEKLRQAALDLEAAEAAAAKSNSEKLLL